MDGIDTNFRPGLRTELDRLKERELRVTNDWQRDLGAFQLEDWIPDVYFEMSEEVDFLFHR